MKSLVSALTDSSRHLLVLTDSIFDERVFAEITKIAARIRNLPVGVIDFKSASVSSLEQTLAMSFLGEQKLYSLGNLSDLSPKDLARVHQLLLSGNLAHAVIAFEVVDKEQAAPVELQPIALAPTLSAADIELFINLVVPQETERRRVLGFFRLVAQSGQQLTMSTIVGLLPYALVVGTRADSFITDELPRIVQADHSLFDLSTAFFAGDEERFKDLFTQLSVHYQEPFWIVFFSEQIFRAYWFIQYRQSNRTVDAQKIAFRLPYSFIQRDWRKHKPTELYNLHNQLCLFDRALKNGAHPEQLAYLLVDYCGSIS